MVYLSRFIILVMLIWNNNKRFSTAWYLSKSFYEVCRLSKCSGVTTEEDITESPADIIGNIGIEEYLSTNKQLMVRFTNGYPGYQLFFL